MNIEQEIYCSNERIKLYYDHQFAVCLQSTNLHSAKIATGLLYCVHVCV